MNNNHIMDWARKSGINFHTGGELSRVDGEVIKALEKFAQYSAKYERRLNAKVCDRRVKAVLAERAACLADVKKVFATFDILPESAEKKMLNSVTSIFIESIKAEIELRARS